MNIIYNNIEDKKALTLVFDNTHDDREKWRLLSDAFGWNKTLARAVAERRKHLTTSEIELLEGMFAQLFTEMNVHASS